MRMTRAALRAQAEAGDHPEPEHQDYVQDEQELRPRSSTYIHEDPIELKAESKPETDAYTDASPVRSALRDITNESYPEADLDVEVQSHLPAKAEQEEQTQEVEQTLRKSTRKSRGKVKGWTKKKPESPIVIEVEVDNSEVSQERHPALPGALQDELTHDQTDQQGNTEVTKLYQPSGVDVEPIPLDEKAEEPDSVVEEVPLLETLTESWASKTPKFDPAIHIPENEARACEDSFVHSITSRSPAKITRPQEDTQQVLSLNSSLQTHPPLRRTSSTKFEESFEAMDSLEDTIEQITAGLPMIPAEEMHSPDSPVKVDRRTPKLRTGPVTPNSAAARTTRTTISKLPPVRRAQDKENTAPLARTPLVTRTTPLKSKTPITKEGTPSKDRTLAKKPSPIKAVPASASKTSSNAPTKPPSPAAVVKKSSAPTQPEKANRKSIMTSSVKPQATTRKSTMPPQKKPAPKQPLANTTNIKAEPRRPAALQGKSHQPSMSFSSSSPKPQSNIHQRRITSGGILSTSKPGFIPAKSSKPPTISTFVLPGEAVAEKLKAQKEAREEKTKQPKMTLAEQKAAKLKADREAREERVRMNQLKAKEVEEKTKPVRPLNTTVLTVSKARAEAAERGRQASKEWAEKMMKKKEGGITS